MADADRLPIPDGARTFSAYAAAGGAAILALAVLNLAANRLPFNGLAALRDYLTHSSN